MKALTSLKILRRQARESECHVEFDPTQEWPRARIFWRSIEAGLADLPITEKSAELIGIEIPNRVPHWHQRLARLGLLTSYRNRGLGTILLNRVARGLEEAGVENIWGKMGGDTSRLVAWYRSLGFVVDSESGLIQKRLGGLLPIRAGRGMTANNTLQRNVIYRGPSI